MMLNHSESYSMSDEEEDSLSSSNKQQSTANIRGISQEEDEDDEYAVVMENGRFEKIDSTIHLLDDILQEDFYKTYKHDKMNDMPPEFIDRFHTLRGEIFMITNRKELEFRRLKPMIARLFPRGKKDTKTKERVDEIIARVYTEATRRMMRLMLDEGDTNSLKIDPERFIKLHPDLASLKQSRPEEFRNIQLFYRAVYIAHRVIGVPCQGFRSHFMRIGTLLENSGIYYATGGRPAKTTMARKELIDKLTKCNRTKRLTNKKVSPSPSVAGATGDGTQGLLALLQAAENVAPTFDVTNPHVWFESGLPNPCVTEQEGQEEANGLSAMMQLEPFVFEYQNMEKMIEIVETKKREEERDLSNMVANTSQLGFGRVVDYTPLLNQPIR